MRRELSSKLTPVYRWVIPGLLTVAAIAVIWRVAVADSPPTLAVILAVALAAGSALLARWLDRAKRVWLDDTGLLVSDYRRETRIQPGEIDEIRSTHWIYPARITITLRRPTIFGAKIVFFPTEREFRPGQPHPVAQELGKLVNKA